MNQNENCLGDTKNYFSREQNVKLNRFLAKIFLCTVHTNYQTLGKIPPVIKKILGIEFGRYDKRENFPLIKFKSFEKWKKR
jgi:hypothetical protein